MNKTSGLILSVVALIIMIGVIYLTYTVTDSHWQAQWDKREAQIAKDRSVATDKARTKEQEYQNEIDSIEAQGKAKQDALKLAAVDASNRAASLLRQIQQLQRTRTASPNSSSGNNSQATDETSDMLTVVLGKSIQRNVELAEYADSAAAAGFQCEVSFQALRK